MDHTDVLKVLPVRGWWMGFTNLFRASNLSFWATRSWLVQTMFWLLFLNGMLAVFLWQTPAEELSGRMISPESLTTMDELQFDQTASALVVFFVFAGMALPVVAVIAGQDALIGERQSGTAAWILSKPVSRPAFILSKLLANTLGILVTGVLSQGLVAYLQLSLKSGFAWPITGFLGALGMLCLNFLFYLTLTYLLGALCNNRGCVLAIGLGAALIGPVILRAVPFLSVFTPWSFFIPVTEAVPTGIAVALGQPVPTVAPIISTVLLIIIFTTIALVHFDREEF